MSTILQLVGAIALTLIAVRMGRRFFYRRHRHGWGIGGRATRMAQFARRRLGLDDKQTDEVERLIRDLETPIQDMKSAFWGSRSALWEAVLAQDKPAAETVEPHFQKQTEAIRNAQAAVLKAIEGLKATLSPIQLERLKDFSQHRCYGYQRAA